MYKHNKCVGGCVCVWDLTQPADTAHFITCLLKRGIYNWGWGRGGGIYKLLFTRLTNGRTIIDNRHQKVLMSCLHVLLWINRMGRRTMQSGGRPMEDWELSFIWWKASVLRITKVTDYITHLKSLFFALALNEIRLSLFLCLSRSLSLPVFLPWV